MGLTLDTLDGHGPVYGPRGEGGGLPGVVILHGSEGPMAGWSHRFAAILAAHGFLALPLSYGEGDFWAAGPIREVPIAPVLDAVAALAGHPRCAGAGLFGWSRGGELALLLASLAGDRLPAVAAHAGSDIVHSAFEPDAMRAGADWRRAEADDAPAWAWPDDPAAVAPGARIEIERYAGPLFLSVGTVDEIWNPKMTLRLVARREKARLHTELFAAEGQGHAFDFATEPVLWARLTAFFRKHLPEAA